MVGHKHGAPQWTKPTAAEPAEPAEPAGPADAPPEQNHHLHVSVRIQNTNKPEWNAGRFWKPRIGFGSLSRFGEKTDEETALVQTKDEGGGLGSETFVDLRKTHKQMEVFTEGNVKGVRT